MDGLDSSRYVVARDGSSLRIVGRFCPCLSRGGVSQEVGTGDGVLCVWAPGTTGDSISMLDRNGRVRTCLQPPNLGSFAGAHPDRATAARPRVLLATHAAFVPRPTPGGLYFVDVSTQTVSTLLPAMRQRSPWKLFPRRDVSTVKRQAGVWDIVLDHGGGEAGRAEP